MLASERKLCVGAVLLAAGAGSRLGNKPKSLLELDGVPLIHRQLAALSGVDEVVVVLGHHAAMIAAALAARPVPVNVKTVTNPKPDEGQPSSVRVGLQSLSANLDAVIVALADQPLLDAEDIGALIDAFKKRSGAAAMVVPRVSGAPGNPVMFDAALRDEWLRSDTNAMGRGWREANPQRVQWFDSDNSHFRVDIDTAEDIKAFAQRTGYELRWPSGLL